MSHNPASDVCGEAIYELPCAACSGKGERCGSCSYGSPVKVRLTDAMVEAASVVVQDEARSIVAMLNPDVQEGYLDGLRQRMREGMIAALEAGRL